jgi:integration host factor subunit beta
LRQILCRALQGVAVTKSDLIEIVAQRAPNFPKRDVEIIVNTMFETMTLALAGQDRIEIRGFGSFVAKARRARDGRNPRTGVMVPVPQKRVPFFTAGKELRERVNTVGTPGATATRPDARSEPSSPGGPPLWAAETAMARRD